MPRPALIPICLLLLSSSLPAPGAHDDRRFERVGVAAGLSGANVGALAQDRQGFVWIGTDEGLVRFDGMSARTFRRDPADPSTLGSNRVSALHVDARGVLWVGTRGGGLSRFDRETERFETFRFDPDDASSLSQDDVADLVSDARGRLWIGTPRGGLCLLASPEAPSPLRFERFRHVDADPRSLADDRTRRILVDAGGTVWVGTMGGLERLVDEKAKAFAHYRNDPADPASLADNEVYAIHRDRRGAIWVGTWGGGVSRMPADAIELPNGRFSTFRKGDAGVGGGAPASAPPGARGVGAADLAAAAFRPDGPGVGASGAAAYTISDNRVMIIREDRAGTLWVATLGGLNEVPASETARDVPRFLRHLPDSSVPYRISGEDIRSVLENRDGDLWFGTGSAGVSRLDRSQEGFWWYRRDPSDPLGVQPEDDVVAVLQDRNGAYWVGTSSGLDRIVPGADRFEPPAITHFRHDPETPDGFLGKSVTSLLEDRQGRIWIGTLDGGLNALAPEEAKAPRPRFRRMKVDPSSEGGLTSADVLSLHEDPRGTLWAGTYRGLNKLVPGEDGWPARFEKYKSSRSDATTLSADSIQALASDPRSPALWVGTYHGLNRLDPRTGRAQRFLPDPKVRDSLSHEYVCAVEAGEDGIWIATRGGGLCRLESAEGGGRFSVRGVAQGFPSETVLCLARGEGGRLWVGTARGLLEMDTRTGATRLLTELDGLLSPKVEVVTLLRDGRLAVGTPGGVTFLPARSAPPEVSRTVLALTGFRLLNRPVPIGPTSVLRSSVSTAPEVVLQHSDYLFSFEFAALTHRKAERLRYAYRLEDFDAGWIQTDAQDRRAVYSGVPPGRYVFRVRSADAPVDDPGASIRVVIRPPWWGTWWARSAALGLLVVLAVAGPLLRLRRARLQTALLERKVGERTAELFESNRQLEAANRAKSVFLASMSHELRTPLNGVLGFAQLMARRAGRDEDDRRSLDIILRSGEHLLGLINDVLSLSKIESGRMSLEEKPFDLTSLLKGIADLLRPRAESKGLALALAPSEEAPGPVRGDEGKLRQIVMNLVGNAIKFTEAGRVELRSRWAGGRAVLEVEDTGPGISRDDIGRLFQPFVQTETGQRSREGTGLGLAISRQFAQLMGGDITCESEVGAGTRFRVEVALPLAAAPAPSEAPAGRVARLAPESGAPSILVVDDVALNREILQRLLSSVGFEVRPAASGEEAVAAFRERRPDLVFMDKRMSGMDGLAATREIRRLERESGARPTVVVALSASALEHEREEILSAGCDEFVAKPFREEALLTTIARHLGVAYEREGPGPERHGSAGAEADAASGGGGTAPLADLAQRLGAIPKGLREELASAVEGGDFLLAEEVVVRFGGFDARLAEALLADVRALRFDELSSALSRAEEAGPASQR